MNKVYEWQKFYDPNRGLYRYRHRGNGIVTDTLQSFGEELKPVAKSFQNMKKPISKAARKTLKSVLNKSEKAGDLILKKLSKRW